MTIHHEIVALIQKEWPTKKAFSDELKAQGEIVLFIDAAMFCHRAVAPPGVHFSGIAYLDQVFLKTVKSMKNDGIKAIIVIMDISSLVPNEKKATQEKRKHGRQHIESYPHGSTFTEGGIVLPDGTLVSVQPDRLMSTPGMRHQIMRVAEQVIATNALYSPPTGCCVIFDYELEGPTAITNNAAVVVGTGTVADNCVRMKQHKRPPGYGEADKAIGYWIRVPEFSKYPVVAASDDGDWIIVLAMMAHATGRHDIFIERSRLQAAETKSEEPASKKQKKSELYPAAKPERVRAKYYLNLHQMVDIITKEMKWDMTAFCLATVMCGTDFIEKNTITNYISTNTVIRAVLTYCKQRVVRVQDVLDHEEPFKELLSLVYQTHLSEPRGKATTACRYKMGLLRYTDTLVAASAKASLKMPNDNINKVHALIKFNVEYWGTGWRLDPVPGLTDFHLASDACGSKAEAGGDHAAAASSSSAVEEF